MIKKSNNISIAATLLCSVHLFGLYFRVGESVYFILDALALVLIFRDLISHNYSSTKKRSSSTLLQLFFVAILLSAVSCWLYHDQNIVATIIAMRYFFYLLVYFQLHKLRIHKEFLEQLIFILAMVYMTVFLTQFLLYPYKIVNYGSIEGFDRGLLRFRIEGAGFLMLSTLLALNRFILTRKTKYIIFYAVGFLFLFLLGFRTLLISGVIASYVLVIRLTANPFKIIRNTCIIGLLLGCIYLLPSFQDYIDSMTEQTKNQYVDGQDYIRVRTFNFFSDKVNVDIGSLIFGNGFPQEDSRYGNLVLNIGAKLNGYIFADLGIIGFAFIYGIFALILFISIFIKAIFTKTSQDTFYLSSYFLYILIASLTTVELYRNGMFGIEAMVLYLIDISKRKS
ncbi:hypothetical protein [Dyadobacter tibetensis]|uniref:hypothetical protein n=1 Tax=Dyadobacter tibetensis TaxID=1211851 RepID=UPI00046F4D9A|nr:hypothetical protein [Dyadobacter tibetensis]